MNSQPPVVNWEEPVSTGEIYISYNDQVSLEASATDNDQVATVEFLYWDHNSEVWKFIGSDNIYPYQVSFDTSPLEPDQAYLTIVRGIDRAGNKSDPYSPLQIIYIERRLLAFLPLMIK